MTRFTATSRILSMLLLLSACGEETGSNSSSSAITGKDFSGRYLLDEVICFDSTGEDITAGAGFSASSAYTYLTITGNRSSETSSSSSCSATITGEITFTETSAGSSGGSIGTMDGRATSIRITGGSSCALSATLIPYSGSPSLTPSSGTKTYSASTPLVSSSADYLRLNDGTLLLRSSIQVVGYPSDMCFLVYVPQ